MGRMSIVLVGKGVALNCVGRFVYTYSCGSLLQLRGSTRKARAKERTLKRTRRERKRKRTKLWLRSRGEPSRAWPAVNCQHLMSALWRAARTAAVTLVMAGAFLTTPASLSIFFLFSLFAWYRCTSSLWSCQCAFPLPIRGLPDW